MGDFNGDGKIDLAVGNEGDDTVGILLGNGNGTFQKQTTYSTLGLPVSIAVGDFNGDGRTDLAVANSSSSAGIGILLGKGDGTFQGEGTYDDGSNAYSVTLGDFNGDGKTDLAVANEMGNTVSILLGNGDGEVPAED